jgi:methylmalonyl-CoA carboxyltransferase 12S subunit
MARVKVEELAAGLERLQAEMAEIRKQLAALEKGEAGANGAAVVVAGAPVSAPLRQAPEPKPEPAGIAEEELLAISAAIGAYLGVRAHIRQIRLLSTSAWAQEGRVSIQASHRLQG